MSFFLFFFDWSATVAPRGCHVGLKPFRFGEGGNSSGFKSLGCEISSIRVQGGNSIYRYSSGGQFVLFPTIKY